MKDKWEARAFLAGSPAQWGWEVDEDAEFSALVGGLDDAINGSIFEHDDASEVGCLPPSTFDQRPLTSWTLGIQVQQLSPLDPATLRDIYLDAYQVCQTVIHVSS